MNINKNIKGISFFLLITMIILAGCGTSKNNENVSSQSETNEKVVFKAAFAGPEDSGAGKMVHNFKEEIEEKTNGKIELELYPAGQLGNNREVLEQLSMNTLEIAATGVAELTGYADEFNVLDFPFLFEDNNHAYKVLDGEVGDILGGKLENEGIKFLGFLERGDSTILTNNKPIYTVDDFKGMKIRGVPSDIAIATNKALGAEPVVISTDELYTSFQQKMVDGVQSYYPVTIELNMHEPAKYVNETYITYDTAGFVMSKESFDSLEPDLQELFEETAKKMIDLQREENQELIDESREIIKDDGVEIVNENEIDRESMKKAVDSVYEKYGEEYRDLIDKIKNTK